MDENQKIILVIFFLISYTLLGSLFVVRLYYFRKSLIVLEQKLIDLSNNTGLVIEFLRNNIKIFNYILEVEREVYSKAENKIVQYFTMPLIRLFNGGYGVKWWGKILVRKIFTNLKGG